MGRPPKAGSRSPDWDALSQTASLQAGYFSAVQARALGFGDALLSYHVKVGNLLRPRRGVFRLSVFPSDVFSHQTALQLHELSDALPARHHLSVPASWAHRRVKPPPMVLLHMRDVPVKERDWKGPVPLTSVLRTLLDCHEVGALDFVRQAERQAVARGLIERGTFARGLKRSRGVRAENPAATKRAKEAPR